jgi:predicted enzyme related to lactoylglutathione lyase
MNLNQVTVYTHKFSESLEFYKNLGLKIIVDSAPRYVRFECLGGDSTFSLHETKNNSECSNIVLYFECENLDEEVERLKNLGLKFEQEPKDQDWLWREAYLKDPTGNKICIFYAGENRQNPPWRVK